MIFKTKLICSSLTLYVELLIGHFYMCYLHSDTEHMICDPAVELIRTDSLLTPEEGQSSGIVLIFSRAVVEVKATGDQMKRTVTLSKLWGLICGANTLDNESTQLNKRLNTGLVVLTITYYIFNFIPRVLL